MSTGRALALVVGVVALVIAFALMVIPTGVGTLECGSILNPEHYPGYAPAEKQCINERNNRAVQTAVAGVSLTVVGLTTRRKRVDQSGADDDTPGSGTEGDVPRLLQHLRELHGAGAVDDDEYKAATTTILADDNAPRAPKKRSWWGYYKSGET